MASHGFHRTPHRVRRPVNADVGARTKTGNAMLQPTQITLPVLLWFMMMIGGSAAGALWGAKGFGVSGGVVGGVLGLVVGHVVGKLPDVLSTRWLLRKLWRTSDDELWRIVNLGFWNFTQTFVLLTLAGRNHDVRSQLPRIITMLESDKELTRVYGWDALRLVFDKETKLIGEYNPRESTALCRAKVNDLKQKMEEAPTPPDCRRKDQAS